MEQKITAEDIALRSVDDDIASSIARSMGWNGVPRSHGTQDYERISEFGPRKIHSTPEVEPDPLREDVGQGTRSAPLLVNVPSGPASTLVTTLWYRVNGGAWQQMVGYTIPQHGRVMIGISYDDTGRPVCTPLPR